MKIFIYSNIYSNSQFKALEFIIDYLNSQEINLALLSDLKQIFCSKYKNLTYISAKHELLEWQPDFLISVGGDGTFLNSLILIYPNDIPILGINTGKLGFLANNQIEEIPIIISNLKSKNYFLEKRILLELETDNKIFGEENFALNDFSINKGTSPYLISIDTYINDNFFNTYWCDGLILSTPTGSTAYSLSCGGPIIFPDSNVFILTPVAPHNLNVRPVIFPESYEFTFIIKSKDGKILITLDSRFHIVEENIKLIVRKSKYFIHLVRFENQNFSKIIRDKLNWGLDKRNI